MYLTLETERLLIRPINLDDTKFILELINSQSWLKFIGDRNVTDEKESKKYIQKILKTKNFFYNVCELKETGKPIGMVSIRKREDEQYPDIGFALLQEYEKNGYALEASQSYLDKVITSNKYDNIIAITLLENKRSMTLLEKLGLHHVGDSEKNNTSLAYYSLQPDMQFC